MVREAADGDTSVSFSLADYEPGTYAIAANDGDVQDVQPVLVSGYDVAVDPPETAIRGESLEVPVDLTATAADGRTTTRPPTTTALPTTSPLPSTPESTTDDESGPSGGDEVLTPAERTTTPTTTFGSGPSFSVLGTLVALVALLSRRRS